MTHPGVGPAAALPTEVFRGNPARFADSNALASPSTREQSRGLFAAAAPAGIYRQTLNFERSSACRSMAATPPALVAPYQQSWAPSSAIGATRR